MLNVQRKGSSFIELVVTYGLAVSGEPEVFERGSAAGVLVV